MNTIHRFVLRDEINLVDMPATANTISIGTVFDSDGKEVISVWVEVDDSDTETRLHKFCVFGTGANMDDIAGFHKRFLGTVLKANKYAFHVYEILMN